MKGVKIIVGMIMDVTKAIEEEVVSIHQKGKKTQTHIPQEIMEDDTTRGKVKEKCEYLARLAILDKIPKCLIIQFFSTSFFALLA